MSRPRWIVTALLAGLWMMAAFQNMAHAADERALQFETKIPLGDVRGRIDHLAVDLKRQRLFVAELGNDSVGVVDLAGGSVIHTIYGLNEPQGVGYEPSTDTLYVANARDGSVRLFDGNAYEPTGRIELGSDADNVRIDPASGHVVIGYGDGALAVIDPSTRNKVNTLPLKSHPESFQIDASGTRLFVNLPEVHAIVVLDGTSGNALATWKLNEAGNFAMALDRQKNRLLVAFRNPPKLAVFSMADGKSIAKIETCGDVDDLFVDGKRERVYLSCGAGFIDVFETTDNGYGHVARIPTATGARTSLFVPGVNRLLVAVRASVAGPAAIWVFKPSP
ncbi:YncE family protein [Bradyrhizobium sp. STM 3557]|uniref:YncE family protein n=1 Tax=Bradyrhizobium sp. STM 3557 TaxID=578920 RepID=UPI003890C9E4